MRRRYFGKSMGQGVFENCTPQEQRNLWKMDDRKEYDTVGKIRPLTIVEAERLQTLPDHYTSGLPRIQAIEAIGNGWTVNVISYILKNMV